MAKYLRTEIEKLQLERAQLKSRLEANPYVFPCDRSKDAKRLTEINNVLNRHYIHEKGLANRKDSLFS